MIKPKFKIKNGLSVISAIFGLIGFFVPDLAFKTKIVLLFVILLINLTYILYDYIKQVSELYEYTLSKENDYSELNNRHDGLSKLFNERITELDQCKNLISDTKAMLFTAISLPNEYEKPQLINIYKFITKQGGSHEQGNL